MLLVSVDMKPGNLQTSPGSLFTSSPILLESFQGGTGKGLYYVAERIGGEDLLISQVLVLTPLPEATMLAVPDVVTLVV